MPQDPDAGSQAPKPPRSHATVAIALIVVGLLLGVLGLGSLGWLMLSRHSGRALLSQMLSAVIGRTVSIDVIQPTVVDRIQRLQLLGAVVYTGDKLVTGA